MRRACDTSGNLKEGSEKALGVLALDAAEQEDLAAMEFAGEEFDTAAGAAEKLSEETDECGVGPALDWRRMNRNFELRRCALAVDTGDRCFLCARMGTHGQRYSVRHGAHHATLHSRSEEASW